MFEQTTVWLGPYLIRIRDRIGVIPAGSVGTVLEHWSDGKAIEVEFYVSIGGDLHEHCVETVESENMERV